eukprot:6308-Heterococcus_DN1.PRE.1
MAGLQHSIMKVGSYTAAAVLNRLDNGYLHIEPAQPAETEVGLLIAWPRCKLHLYDVLPFANSACSHCTAGLACNRLLLRCSVPSLCCR